MGAGPKRRKIDQLASGGVFSSPSGKEESLVKTVPVFQTGSINFRIEQAKNEAIAQAQQEGCTGSYRIFDSPFGNFFVPVVPSRRDLTDLFHFALEL